eukprot:1375719-Rhodomonas_salina.1
MGSDGGGKGGRDRWGRCEWRRQAGSRSFKRVDEANAIAGMKEAGSTEGEDSEGREDSWHFRLIPQHDTLIRGNGICEFPVEGRSR